MRQVKLIVSNWKMNLNVSDSKKLINDLIKLSNNNSIEHVVCPQFALIPSVSRLIKESKIILGAQDCHHEKIGAYTGDTSAQILKELNCKYVILGHSERRDYHSESNELVKKKVFLAISEGLKPIICVSESIEDRKNNNYFNIIEKQLDVCVPDDYNNVVIAYEPIWSIGTGQVPTNKEILEMKKFIYNFLKSKKRIHKVNFLYGGSVNSINFHEIMNDTKVDGALIGGSSLKIIEMNKILTFC